MQSPDSPLYAGIVLDSAVGKILSYEVPKEFRGKISPGSRVSVPLRTGTAKGTVWHFDTVPPPFPTKPIREILIEPSLLTPDMIALAEWMSRYYLSPLNTVLGLFLPKLVRNPRKSKKEQGLISPFTIEELLALAESLEHKSPKQAAVLRAFIAAGSSGTTPRPATVAGTKRDALRALLKKNILSLKEIQPLPDPFSENIEYVLSEPKQLTSEQSEAFESIRSSLISGGFSPHLLYGVTGSGKTEVYLRAVKEALDLGKGVIFLVPEVILTSQTVERIKSRFRETVAVLHHDISDLERKRYFESIHNGSIRIIVGARSALFSPVPNLGLIIVDEEQESSYKQSGSSPYYHARDVAVIRAKLANATVILGSATPSFESYYNALQGKYKLNILSHRPGKHSLPRVRVIDMKEEMIRQNGYTLFSSPLITAIGQRLDKGEQSLLLLNRRGYYTSQLCPSCSYVSKCPGCDVALTFHREENILRCHVCDFTTPPPTVCPCCKGTESLRFKGAGTEKAEKVLYSLFPGCRVLRMDADTTKQKGAHEALFKKFRSGKADILVGTQMIAKGLHFPSVTLAAVLHADTGLNIPDFRASESLFRLITQAAGRAGRSDLPGEVILQTFSPENSVITTGAKQDYEAFFRQESEVRKAFDYPPFTRIIKITLVGPSEQETENNAQELRRSLIKQLPPFATFLPVSPSGHAKIEHKHRFQFLIKTHSVLSLAPILSKIPYKLPGSRTVVHIDVDPISTFF